MQKTEGAKNNEKTSNIDSSTQKAQVKSEPFSQEIDRNRNIFKSSESTI